MAVVYKVWQAIPRQEQSAVLAGVPLIMLVLLANALSDSPSVIVYAIGVAFGIAMMMPFARARQRISKT